jgi:hypothetical protein
MKFAEVRMYAVLLLIASGFAYQSWTDETAPKSTDTVVIFEPGKDGVTSVDWTGERSAAHLEFSGPVDDSDVWITAGRRKRIQAPAPPPEEKPEAEEGDGVEPSADTEPPPAPTPVYGEPALTSFPGNTSAQALAERFSPLTALRRFDSLSDDQLADMGLAEASSMLLVEGGGRTMRLEIGDKAYGSSDLYAREPGSTTAYLLSRKVVGSLKSASTSLRDKNLFGFAATDAVAASIQKAGAKSPTETTHQGRHDKDNAFWSAVGSDEVDPVLDTLIKRIFEAKAMRYLVTTDAPAAEDLEPLVHVVFRDERSDLGAIAFARRVKEDASTGASTGYSWYARSTRSREQWVEVSKAVGTDLVDALDSLN